MIDEEQILQKALEDYEYALKNGYQEKINEYHEYCDSLSQDPRTHISKFLTDFYSSEADRFKLGLCHYLLSDMNEPWELDLLVPTYFEVCGLNQYKIENEGDISLRISWLKRALELIRHRKRVELYKNLGNPRFV